MHYFVRDPSNGEPLGVYYALFKLIKEEYPNEDISDIFDHLGITQISTRSRLMNIYASREEMKKVRNMRN